MEEGADSVSAAVPTSTDTINVRVATPSVPSSTVPIRRSALKNEDAWKRINFLYQSAHHMVGLSHPKLGANLSRIYLQDMRKVASKLVLRLDSSVKNTVCKRCGVLLIPGLTATTRIDEAGVREESHSFPFNAEPTQHLQVMPELKMDEDVPHDTGIHAQRLNAAQRRAERRVGMIRKQHANISTPNILPPKESVSPTPITVTVTAATASLAAPLTHRLGKAHRTKRGALVDPRLLRCCMQCGTQRRVNTKPMRENNG
jgi:RNase P subunit RPR2